MTMFFDADYQRDRADAPDYGLRFEGPQPRFQRPGSALRRETRRNPRNLPCPSCGQPNRLTPADRAQGYQCDDCARRDEGGY